MIENAAKEKLVVARDIVENRIDDTYVYIEAYLNFMGNYVNKHAISDGAIIYDLLRFFTNHDSMKELIPLYEIMWIDKSGKVHAALRNNASDISLETSAEIVSHPEKCRSTPQKIRFGKVIKLDKLINSFCYGVTDSNQEYSGTLVAGLDLHKFENSIQKAIGDDTISFAVYNDNADIIYESPDNYISTHYRDSIKSYFFSADTLKDTLINVNNFQIVNPELIHIRHNFNNGTTVVIATKNFPTKLIAGKLLPLAVDLVFLVLVGTAITFFVYRRFVKPVLLLSRQTEQMVKGNTELGEQKFNYFELDNLAKTISRVVEQQKVSEENKQLNFLVKKIEAASYAKTEFIQNIQHELRTPLNHIIGSSEMLALEFAESIPKKYRQYLDTISKSGRSLLEIINNIIAIADYSSGKVSLQEETCSLKKIINDLMKAFKNKMEVAQIKCSSDIQVALPLVFLDRVQFSEALAYIIDNAIKFNKPQGKISITARQVRNRSIRLEIADTGIGIPNENLNKITKVFNDKDSLLADVHKGLGLGLSVANCIFDLHNIRLEAESTVDLGTKIIVIIPAIRTKEINYA